MSAEGSFSAAGQIADIGDRRSGREFDLFNSERQRLFDSRSLGARLSDTDRGRQFDSGMHNGNLGDRASGRQADFFNNDRQSLFGAVSQNADLRDAGYGRDFDARALNARLGD